ncbi:MAG: IS110 family transposase [Chitinophagaceae bacterium]|nr:MAG: IS110 family transposase [Chitinophagaceae bacterium]
MRRQEARSPRCGIVTTVMKNETSTQTVGIDLGDRKHSVCVLDADGLILKQESITNTRGSLTALSRRHSDALMVMEVGMQSPWISRFLTDLGHRVLVANPRKVRAIYKNDRKCDRKDAEMLARIARTDESLLHPVQHSSEDTQIDLLQIKLRDNLVRQRVDIISSVRFTLKSLGIKLRSPSTTSFVRHARKALASEYKHILTLIEPSLQVLDSMTAQIRELEKCIEKLAVEKYPEAEFLTRVGGVGTLTSLTFVLTIVDPERFRRRRDVGAYLGLVPRRDQSGGIDKQLGITKAGDSYMRRLLVNASQYILGPFGPDCALKRHGLKLAARGGARSKKKAVIATARKLSVLMLTLWHNEELYEPERGIA